MDTNIDTSLKLMAIVALGAMIQGTYSERYDKTIAANTKQQTYTVLKDCIEKIPPNLPERDRARAKDKCVQMRTAEMEKIIKKIKQAKNSVI